jgi:mono/diheme cytochrome c family protein
MRNLSALFILVLVLSGCSAAATPSPTPNPTAAPAVGDAQRGQQIFTKGFNGAPPCSTCHLSADVNFGFSLGPNLMGISTRAGNRVEDLDAAAYIHQSILEPRSYIVGGYRDIMYPEYSKFFEEQDITDLIAYLMTL